MGSQVTLPLWLFLLILTFAAVTFASHFLFPSVRWFFRRRLEKAVARLNRRLTRPIEPFKLARRRDTIQRVLYAPEVLAAVTEHARTEGVPEEVAFEQARRYAREIVPGFSAFAYFGFAIRAAKWLATSLFRVRLARLDEAKLAAIPEEATVVFVMNHRSNMDYVLVTYLVAQRTTLSYAVGEWARVWPLRTLIRAMGAYFIRRKSRGELYRTVLATYVTVATRARVTQAMFPEGRLSLTGAAGEPKLGLLAYITEAAEDGTEVVFVPTALNYDRVLEDRVLIGAQGGGGFPARIRVVFRWLARRLILRVRGLTHHLGYAAVSFGDPLSLASFPGDTEALGQELMARIEAVMPVLPVPLLAAMLLEAEGPLDRATLERRWNARLRALEGAGVVLHVPRGNPAYALENALRILRDRNLLAEGPEGIAAAPHETAILRFYAASITPQLAQLGDAAPATSPHPRLLPADDAAAKVPASISAETESGET
ncbi:1-acyl-sn-glycerol-3-phosphate acyltransferase [Vannielia litorea]|uniref:1-acyl-sn-glycerol-3-phosphate acyltransferase n=1 Tax=Vannielia litorea TaxID=1217970 RepID=UPI001C969BE6|nr:1-acyl-sn-glycerol-3-phosphate acyltransferase [Vannielia litorea]MBY6048270.1 1-acyl-sn-glycerol-3-phosphate acyltransferase [Vannielia litorea]MBY6075684.1 1-acyl-sn-glycerol-3-phosphate acyltransferase [Vannielia litorea]